MPEKYGVFDIETRRSAQDVGGWHRADKMGISVAVLYDGKQDKFFSFEEHEIDKLLEHLLDGSPPKVHFIFISRNRLEIRGTTIRNGSQIAYLSTTDLALGNQDIEALYTTVLNKEISRHDAIDELQYQCIEQ